MKEVTIICCYNNLKQYKTFTESLAKQTTEYELIGIDNTKSKYTSCSKEFNIHMMDIKTPYVIFCHQDIEFTDSNNISDFIRCIKKIDSGDILGVAGRKEKGGSVVSNILQGQNLQYAGKERVKSLIRCEVIDECFFGGYTDNFIKHPFDEQTCNNWHLYAVESCLNARSRGQHVYICPIKLIHRSKGKMNYIYNKQFYKLSRKYSKDIRYLNTTCAYASTRFPNREIAFIKRAISLWLGRY